MTGLELAIPALAVVGLAVIRRRRGAPAPGRDVDDHGRIWVFRADPRCAAGRHLDGRVAETRPLAGSICRGSGCSCHYRPQRERRQRQRRHNACRREVIRFETRGDRRRCDRRRTADIWRNRVH